MGKEKLMNNYKTWSRLTFKTTSFRKNFDLCIPNENFITENEGHVSILRFVENKLPMIIGEYSFSVWNIGLTRDLNIDLIELINMEEFNDDIYKELRHLIRKNKFNLDETSRLILIHTLILHPQYRKLNISEEFIEFLYRDFYHGNNSKMIALIKPIQDNLIDREYFYNHKLINVKNYHNEIDNLIPATTYYNLNKFKNSDEEMIKYKLFSVASRCGFNRLHDTNLFEFEPTKIHERLRIKNLEYKKTLI